MVYIHHIIVTREFNEKSLRLEGKILPWMASDTVVYKAGERKSYGFIFSELQDRWPVQLRSVGWEERTEPSYDWDNRKREEHNHFLFQYTLSGEGKICFGAEREVTLNAGDAFYVIIPGNHRYFLPRTSDRWEFVYVMLYGEMISSYAKQFKGAAEGVVHLPRQSPLIRQLMQLYQKAAADRIKDGYYASALAYPFLMEWMRMMRGDVRSADADFPAPVRAAISLVETRFGEPIGLDEMAEAAGLSRYYFSRLFRQATGFTPVQYLNRVRLSKAIEWLNRTDWTIEQIGRAAGFTNGNYFCKVFRKTVGTSPERFRRGRHTLSVDELRFH